jgi:single-stranded DNA-specific DHH superfamily exonuclease
MNEYDPDKVFVLDKALISQEFIDQVHKPMVWLDHHPLVERSKIIYYNPLKHKSKEYDPDNRPTTYWAYKTVESERSGDLWIAMVGCIGDWFIPEFAKEFAEKYPDLLPKELHIKSPGTVLFETRLGLLIKIIDFNLKYTSHEAMTAVKILTRISDPYEILDQKTAAGKYLYKHYEKLNHIYEDIKSRIKITKSRMVLFEYEDRYAFTGFLANELLYHHPEKLIVIVRRKDNGMICSFRSARINVRTILEKALVGIDGYGGGHDRACGGCIQVHDWKRFIDRLKNELKKEKTAK